MSSPEAPSPDDGIASDDVPPKPWERLVIGIDPASRDGDPACMVVAVYSALTGKLSIADIETHAE